MRYLLILLIIGCGRPQDLRPIQGQLLLSASGEFSPIHFHDHDLLLVYRREEIKKIEIYPLLSSEKITEFVYDLSFSSAIVLDDVLYVFGSNKAGTGIYYYKTMDLVNWVSGGLVFSSINHLYNSSVIYEDGIWIMVYESFDSTFSSKIAITEDLNEPFSSIGTSIRPNIYTACPTIRKFNNEYYVIYLSHEGNQYQTRVSRTYDFINWEHGPVLFKAGYGEGINFSDVEFIDNKVLYLTGDQKTWSQLKYINLETTLFDYLSIAFF